MKNNKALLTKLFFIIIIGIIGIILISYWRIKPEIKEANAFCESIDGDYEFYISFNHNHYCNEKEIFKHINEKGESFWSFNEKEIIAGNKNYKIKINFTEFEDLIQKKINKK